MLAPPTLTAKLNVPHCTKMALIHDMAEAVVGDITPVDTDVPKVEKARRETEVMDYISKTLLGRVYGGVQGADMRCIWQEYEDNETLEAKFVHDVDKMELLLQMIEYERTYKIPLDEFLGVSKRIVLPEVKDWAAEVLEERKTFWQNEEESSK